MKHVLSVFLVLAAVSAAGQAQSQSRRGDVDGTWSARVRESERADGNRIRQLQLQMNVDTGDDGRNWSNWGQSVPLSDFTNLPATLDTPQDVTFELRRDAGTLFFQGRFESGRGVGHLSFTANREFARVMEQQTRDTFTDRELMSFALMDVSRAFVKELQSLGYKDVTLNDARKLRIHGTTGDFVRSIRAAGYPDVSIEDVLKLRIHGITPQYIANLKSEGLQNPSLDEVLKFRIHGITSDYVKEMRAAGLGSDLEDLLQMRIHGVTPAFAREMAALGYKLDASALRRFRIHGVSASYVREMQSLGYKNLSADALVKFRIHGVTPAFVKDLKASGYDNLSEEETIDWAIHGRRLLKYKRK